MSARFLHEHPDFKSLIELTAKVQSIQDPSLVEKDYWLMHTLWGLQHAGLSLHLKGGTSLSKGFGCIHRFSEDIDLRIEPEEPKCGFKVYAGKNHDDDKHRESRTKFFEWVCSHIQTNVPGFTDVKRDPTHDDVPKMRSGGIRLNYRSSFGTPSGIKEGILLEVGFDKTAPNLPRTISSWAYEHAMKTSNEKFHDNRALDVPCYEPKFTFVEKLQAVIRKFRHYKEGKSGASLPANFLRHYYDLFQLIELKEVQDFIGTAEYETFKKERFGGDDTRIANSDALKLSDQVDLDLFKEEYKRSEPLYYRGRPTLQEILERIAKDIERL